MADNLFKQQVYAGILEILRDDKFYYHSDIASKYCRLTEKGERAVIEWLALLAPIIIEKEKKEFDKKAKELVWDELKK